MIAQFALRLIVGMSLMWAVMPRRDVTSGFFRIQMLVTLALGVLAALTLGQFTGSEQSAATLAEPGIAIALCVGIAVVSFLGSVYWTLERRRGGTILGFAVLGLSAAALFLSTPMPGGEWSLNFQLMLAGELTTAALVGGFLTAMLLGHWYLTAPTMTTRPLTRLNGFLGLGIAARAAVSLAAVLLAGGELAGQTQWMWLSLRWGAGIFGPAVLVAMVYRILQYRNTQSATGVLFVGVILTFIGELSATLLSRIHGVPF